MSRLLEIQPRELKFTVELKKQSSCVVQLTNITNHYLAFKVKTTSPKKYCVRPNVGIVLPNSSTDFTVVMQVPKAGPIDLECRDKFLIQSTSVSAETTDEDITASMFLKDRGNYVEEKKLKVILVGPPDSPTLSPINGALSQGLGSEASFFIEEPVNGVENMSAVNGVIEDKEDPLVRIDFNESEALDAKKVKPAKSVMFKLDKDVEKLSPKEDAEELKQSKHVEELNPVDKIEELNPVTNREKMNLFKYVEESKPIMDVEELKSAKDVAEESNPVTAREELKPAKNIEEPALDPGLNTVRDSDAGSKLDKAVELKSMKVIEDSKLLKDVEGIMSRLCDFELKLSKAEFAISKLMVERNTNIEERKILQEKLAELSKRGVRTVQVGFPLLFVFMVGLIGIVLGYRLHP